MAQPVRTAQSVQGANDQRRDSVRPAATYDDLLANAIVNDRDESLQDKDAHDDGAKYGSIQQDDRDTESDFGVPLQVVSCLEGVDSACASE